MINNIGGDISLLTLYCYHRNVRMANIKNNLGGLDQIWCPCLRSRPVVDRKARNVLLLFDDIRFFLDERGVFVRRFLIDGILNAFIFPRNY